MFPASEMFIQAEVDYRRERLIAARPSKRVWRRRGQRTTRTRPAPQRSQGVSAA